jgi:hypothetical protein
LLSSLSQPLNCPHMRAASDGLFSCRAGDFSKFRERLAEAPQLARACDAEGNTPLHWFALRNHREAVEVLLSLGAIVDAQSNTLQTPLMWATVRGNVEMAMLLLDHGASVDARDSLGATPLILATQHRQHLAFLALLFRGADPTAKDIRGASIVHWAAYKGNVTVGRMLQRRGVDLSVLDGEGMSALHRACRGGQCEFIEFLLTDGSFDVEERSREVPGVCVAKSPQEHAMELQQDKAAQLCAAHVVRKRKRLGATSLRRLLVWLSQDVIENRPLMFMSAFPWVWICTYVCTVVVYATQVMELTSHFQWCTTLLWLLLIVLWIVFYTLWGSNPGLVETKYALKNVRGARVRQLVQAQYSARRGDVEQSSGHVLMDGQVVELMNDTSHIRDCEERNSHICFSCDVVKVCLRDAVGRVDSCSPVQLGVSCMRVCTRALVLR